MAPMGRSIGASKKMGRTSNSISSVNKALSVLVVMAFVFSVAVFVSFTSVTRNSSTTTTTALEASLNMKSSKVYQTTTGSDNGAPTAPRSTMGDLVSWMLQPELDKDMNTNDNMLERLRRSPHIPLEFPPGSLSLSHADALKYCYADPRVYGKHLQKRSDSGENIRVSYSDEHKLVYVMVPKSGSSTARHMLKTYFKATETTKSLQPIDFQKGGDMEGVEVLSFVRDPLSRFFSQYDEAYVRTAPWQSTQTHPFPYIYDGIHSYSEYEDVFCPPSTRENKSSRKECIFKPSAENGTLASRFEKFVRDYDGRDPYDIHLVLQVPFLSSPNGIAFHVTQIYNTTDSESGWKRIAKQFLGSEDVIETGKVIEGRSYPRRFNSKLVSEATQQRICELTLIDYCCLNLPLPEVCRGKHYDTNSKELFCTIDRVRGRIVSTLQCWLSVFVMLTIQISSAPQLPGVYPKKGRE